MDKALNLNPIALLTCPCCGHDAHYVACTTITLVGVEEIEVDEVPCGCRSIGVPWVCPACGVEGPHFCGKET